ncbi:MAG: methyltransferase domain-containing protein, partial [Planctomycetia bacterium]|nr:methyltransferase domain-containing protein [Planctomycetia bacterium]
MTAHPRDPAVHQFTFACAASPQVSIIIPTKNAARLVSTCIASARATAGYDAYDITVIDHDSDEPELLESAAGGLSVLRYSGPFNYAAMNNAAVRGTDAPLVLLLNNDIDGFSPGWLDQLVATIALDPTIAAVGCLLTYPDGDIQHAGVMFTPKRHGFHGHAGLPHDALGYRGRIRSLQEYSAVTAAMMLVRREAFDAVGGFDETFPDDYNDVDLCLRLRRAGWKIAYTPHVTAVHWESRTRTAKWTAKDVFEARWAGVFGRDPFHSPHFSHREVAPDALELLWRERKAVALRDSVGGGPGANLLGYRRSFETDFTTGSPGTDFMATFHFVEDYERHVAALLANHPLHEAMSLAVGGHYDDFKVILAEVLVQNGLRDGMRLVDLGCGSGRAAKGVSERVQIEYLGIDIVPKLLDYAASVCPKHYRFKCHRELSIPADDASADMLCAFSLFTHLLHEESYVYLQESFRVLKPGGKVVMSFLEFAAPSHWNVFVPT